MSNPRKDIMNSKEGGMPCTAGFVLICLTMTYFVYSAWYQNEEIILDSKKPPQNEEDTRTETKEDKELYMSLITTRKMYKLKRGYSAHRVLERIQLCAEDVNKSDANGILEEEEEFMNEVMSSLEDAEDSKDKIEDILDIIKSNPQHKLEFDTETNALHYEKFNPSLIIVDNKEKIRTRRLAELSAF